MTTSTSRSATISLLRSARRMTPVVPTGHPRRQRRRRVAAVGPDDQPVAHRDVHERRRRSRAPPAPRPAGSSRGRPRRTPSARSMPATSAPCSAIRRSSSSASAPSPSTRLGGEEPAPLVGRRALVSATVTSRRASAGSSAATSRRDLVGERRAGRRAARAGSGRRRSTAAAACSPPPTERPPNDGMTSAWMSTTTSATLAAARAAASSLPKQPAVEGDPEVAPRRHERGPDVRLAGAARVVVGDHVGRVARGAAAACTRRAPSRRPCTPRSRPTSGGRSRAGAARRPLAGPASRRRRRRRARPAGRSAPSATRTTREGSR